jgi:hypothetical protein
MCLHRYVIRNGKWDKVIYFLLGRNNFEKRLPKFGSLSCTTIPFVAYSPTSCLFLNQEL